MKKSAIVAGFLAALPLASLIMQHRVAAMEFDSFNLGDITVSNQYQDMFIEDEGEVLAASTEAPAVEVVEEPEAKPVHVTINSGDTLSKIAAAHNTTYKRLFDANEFIVDPNIINPGDKLRIPEADEELASRPLPQPKVATAVKPVVKSRAASKKYTSNAPAVASGSVWDRLAACESGGNWSINTGNGYYGGLQFLPSTWRAVGGTGLPHQHSREEQIKRGQILQQRSGWGQWPACTRMLGLR